MNLVVAVFIAFLLLIVAVGVPCTLNAKWIPQSVKEMYVYGKPTKLIGKKSPILTKLVRLIQVPKSWFSHFYWFASVYSSLVLMLLVLKFVYSMNPPEPLITYINLVAYNTSSPLTNPNTSILVTLLFTIHAIRRLITSLLGFITVLLAYGADFSSQDLIDRGDETHSFSIQQTSFVAIFLFASYQQNSVHRTLASYRKKPGTEDKYTLPKGGWFNYVSCPNYLCEIIIYVSLYFTLGSHHVPWGIITTWVVTNQTLAALMCHKWYRSHFKDYPRLRKAIFPFLL